MLIDFHWTIVVTLQAIRSPSAPHADLDGSWYIPEKLPKMFCSRSLIWIVARSLSEMCSVAWQRLQLSAGVGALESVPSLAVIEGFDVPFRQHEIFAVVFGMAVHAFLTRTRLDVVGGVQSFSRDDARRDFVVTAQALEYGFAGRDFVAS